MTINCALTDILDEASTALSDFDLGKLLVLEQRIAVLAETDVRYESDDICLIRVKKRQLDILLQNTRTNLDTLTRLHARNTRNQWAQ
jgi:hypothetical protein